MTGCIWAILGRAPGHWVTLLGHALAAGPLAPTELRQLNQLGNCWVFEGRGRVCEDLGLVRHEC